MTNSPRCRYDTDDGPCLNGRAYPDDDFIPPFCHGHLDSFQPWIHAVARMLAHTGEVRPEPRPQLAPRPAPLKVRGGRHLSPDLEGTAAFLSGGPAKR